MIARARALDPDSRAIAADEAILRFNDGQRAAAIATLEQLVALDPKFMSWHGYLALVYLATGRDADYLREAIIAAELRGQTEELADLRRAQQRWATGGRPAMLDELAATEAERWKRGRGSAVMVARLRALAHDRDGAMRWLQTAEAGHDRNLARLPLYPELTPYHDDPDFQGFVRRVAEAVRRAPEPDAG